MHQKYRNAHKVFGGSHLAKFVKNLAHSPHKRSTALKHITAEADLRIAEPVAASFGVISKLWRNIAEEEEDLRRLRLVLGVYRGVQGNIFDFREHDDNPCNSGKAFTIQELAVTVKGRPSQSISLAIGQTMIDEVSFKF